MPWIEKNITMVDDVSSEKDRPDFGMYPYQIDILKQWEDLGMRKHVTVVMCEQMRQDIYIRLWDIIQADI